MGHFFYKIYKSFKNHRKTGFFLAVILLVLLGYVASLLHYKEDVTALIPSNEKSQELKKVLNTVEFNDKVIVMISSKKQNNEGQLIAYAQKSNDSLHKFDLVKNIQGNVKTQDLAKTYDFIYQHLPLFLKESDYAKIEKKLTPDSIAKTVQNDYKTLISPAGFLAKKFIRKDPLHLATLGLDKLKRLRPESGFELYQNYLFTKDHKNILLFISTKNGNSAEKEGFVKNLYKLFDHLNTQFSSVKGQGFGAILFSVANAKQIKNDIQLTLSIALAVLLVLLITFYKKLTTPIILFVPTIFGGLLALALMRIFQPEISLISLGIGSVLMGISLDYSLHILTHYRNNYNPEKLFEEVTQPVLMSSLTTAVAFFCLVFLKSEALTDLGVFAGISVLGSAIFALVFVPQLYRKREPNAVELPNFIDRFAHYDFSKNKILVAVVVLLFVGGLFYFYPVDFNQNLSALNFKPEKLRQAENKLNVVTDSTEKSIYVVAYGNTVNEALQNNQRTFQQLESLEDEGKIQNFSSIGGVVVSQRMQEQKIIKWNNFWTEQRKQFTKDELVKSGNEFGLKGSAFEKFYGLLNSNFQSLSVADFQNFPGLYSGEFIKSSSDNNFHTVISTVKVAFKQENNVLRAFESQENVFAIDREALNSSFLGKLKTEFNFLVLYLFIGIFLILLLFFKSLKITLLTLVPIGVTWVIALGLMKIIGLEFNVFNIIISTFIFGLGIDYSIFMTNGLLREKNTGEKVLSTYRTSILLSVLTTLLGFGALIFAKHPALQSISWLSIIGILTVLGVTFILQPLLFNIFLKFKR